MSESLARSQNNLDVGTPGRGKKKCQITKWLIIKICIIVAISFSLFFIAQYAIPSSPPPPGGRDPTQGEIVGLAIINLSEAAVTAVGLAFLVSYARYLPGTPSIIKPKIYCIYIAVCWFLIEWFPHAQLHKMYGPDVNANIALEMTFHWINLVALSLLAYHQFNIMLLCMSLTKVKENLARLEQGEKTIDEEREALHRKNPVKRFFLNTKVQVVLITIAFFFALFFGVRKAIPTVASEVTEVQAGLLTAIEVVGALTFGIGASFAILMAINISRNIAPRYQKVAWASYGAICYIWLTDYFHGKTHNSMAGDDYTGRIIVDIFFHIGVTAAGFVLIHYQRKVIKANYERRHNSKQPFPFRSALDPAVVQALKFHVSLTILTCGGLLFPFIENRVATSVALSTQGANPSGSAATKRDDSQLEKL